MSTLLIVDADPILREHLARALCSRGIAVRLAATCSQALQLAQASAPDMLLLDPRSCERGSQRLIDEMRAIEPSIEIVIWSLYARAVRPGGVRYLLRPADADDIVRAYSRTGSLGRV